MRLFALMLIAGLIAGCNTVEGIGKDIKAGGAKLERAAQ